MLQRVPHAFDDGGARVMRVECRRTRRGIFFLGQQRAQRVALDLPFRLVRSEHVLRERTPADIAHQLGPFLGRRGAAVILNCFEDADCVDVGADLLLGPTFTNAILVGDAIVLVGSTGNRLAAFVQPALGSGWYTISFSTVSSAINGRLSSALTLA